MKRLQTKLVADMSRYTENFFCGMTPRQTFCGAAALGIVIGGALLLHIPSFLCVLFGFPVLLAGFARPDGLPLEKWLAAWIESKWRSPIIRTYQTENDVYDFLWRGTIQGRKYFDPWEYLNAAEERNGEMKPNSRKRKRNRSSPLEEEQYRQARPEARLQQEEEAPAAQQKAVDRSDEQRLAEDFQRLLRQPAEQEEKETGKDPSYKEGEKEDASETASGRSLRGGREEEQAQKDLEKAEESAARVEVSVSLAAVRKKRPGEKMEKPGELLRRLPPRAQMDPLPGYRRRPRLPAKEQPAAPDRRRWTAGRKENP